MKKMARPPLGKRLFELREERGLSLSEAQKGSGVLGATIYAMETGRSKKPSEDYLRKLAEYYEVEYEELGSLAYQAGSIPAA